MPLVPVFRSAAPAALLACFVAASLCAAQENRFEERRQTIKKRFEKNKGRSKNSAVHKPPMVKAKASDLPGDEPVIGVYLGKEARAYPLTMLFGGGGIFELLNDTCGDQPIAASW